MPTKDADFETGGPHAAAENAVRRFYRRHAPWYDLTRWLVLRGRARTIPALGLRPDSRVLEIGCGTGRNFAMILRRLDPAAGALTGLDFSPEMLRRAHSRIAAGGWINAELVQADAANVQLPGRFDAVLFAYSLSLVSDWQSALERARDHLTAGGRLVVLDFGRFERWGPLRPPVRSWLRMHHVQADRPYVERLRSLLPDFEVRTYLGGYYFVAVGRRV